ALQLNRFPPVLRFPHEKKDSLLSTWLSYPTFTWVPECKTVTRKASCIVEGCSCVPAVKEYNHRTVHDIEHKTLLYFARYACTGLKKGKTFSTIDDEYISSSNDTLVAFPYLLTYQTGISLQMFDLVYDSMLTSRGIYGAVRNVTRRRQQRYYHIVTQAALTVKERRQEGCSYSPPMLESIELYMTKNACIDFSNVLGDIKLSSVRVSSSVWENGIAVNLQQIRGGDLFVPDNCRVGKSRL
ncbi:hypothetical protein PHMEG_00035600, partial [Phytophthora megakarya]